ncbi:polyprenyl synthetase family protein [Actinocatenispora rupis]|uniref:Dimethylallyltransferase n=1 Tax=Actinocatenispora rupis TaxID=519421 RepID=A0A8J3J5D7_9ACTN|nr:polyprenyl synthetase family protein [Actinocatenispora rupis]GID09673.1 dimethylallyltransferase [Actinocatenispora rupis]
MTAVRPDTDAAGDLAEVRDLVAPHLLATVRRLNPRMRRVVGYHCGWWDEHGTTLGADAGGKSVRPTLTVRSAEAVGAAAEQAVPAAVAVELVHNFSLLHDDVMDGDRTRRHRPTAWSMFGVPEAILAGDAVLTLATEVLTTAYPAGLATEAVRRLSAAVLRLVDGQTADVAFERRTDVTLAECLEMAGAKTGALLGCACELGALVAGAGATRTGRLRQYGEHLGLAFQLVDDLLGIWGDPATTGKPALADLRTRKKSLPVVAALSAGNADADRLARLYLRAGPLVEADLPEVAELVDRAGGRRWATERAEVELGAALTCLRAADAEPVAATRLVSLGRLLTRRDR